LEAPFSSKVTKRSLIVPSAAVIRELFLAPKPVYSVPETADILGMTRDELRGWMEVGEIEGTRSGGALVVEWAELVSFGVGFWSQEAVEEALGAAADAIPDLLRLADFEVRIPQLQIVALERVAERDGRTVSTVLAAELRDFVSAHSEWLEGVLPGFRAALASPCGFPPE
jgi:hypothetical protein